MISIRKQLLSAILLSVAVTTILVIAGNYYLERRNITHRIDSWLEQSALVIDSILKNNHTLIHHTHDPSVNAEHIQERISPPDALLQFMVIDERHGIIVHSNHMPELELEKQPIPFNTVIDPNGDHWRIHMLRDPESHLRIAVTTMVQTPLELTRLIIKQELIVLITIFPILGLVIWLLIGYNLRSIKRISTEVAQRAPNYLDPVPLNLVPREIQPLVEALNQLFLQLTDALDREKRFASDAAHELRTPLTVLKTQAQVAQHAQTQEEQRDALSKLSRGVDRCTHIVQQLLTLSRIMPQTETTIELTQVNLANLVTEIVAELVPIALEKDLDIELNAANNHIFIKANATSIGILTRNLVDNAIRYTPAGGEIKVDVFQDQHFAVLRVSDNGSGIPVELRSRVFERFYRVLGTNTQGSGLGLDIVQKIATLHRAPIDLGTPPWGQGLEVTLQFPLSSFQ